MRGMVVLPEQIVLRTLLLPMLLHRDVTTLAAHLREPTLAR
jgi:hydrogenase-4 membrane subunit HyfE